MSGGCYDYAYSRIGDLALQVRSFANGDVRRLAFADLLDRAATAAHAVEWVDSGDWGDGEENDALDAVLSPQDVLKVAREQAENAHRVLGELLEESK